jgi:hypothetical protein
MRIAAINGLKGGGDSSQSLEPLVFGQFEKVEILLKVDLETFDTHGFLGYIDYCDSTETQLITSRTAHTFVYPEGYQKVLDPSWLVPDEDIPLPPPEDPDAPPLTPEEEAAAKEAARVERAKKKAEAEEALALENRHRVILYFSSMQDYGVISNEFLSQIDILQSAFPTYVGLGDDGSGRLVIKNPNFTATSGITKNTNTQLQFVIQTFDEFGNPIRSESTFKVLPKIFESLKEVKTFNRYQVDLPASVEKIDYQGDFDLIENNFGMDFYYNEYYDGPKPVTVLEALNAMPRGGKPVFMYDCYSPTINRDDFKTISIEELPDTRKFYSVERLKYIARCFSLPLLLSNTNTDKEDPLPLGPDYSRSKVLKVVSLPRLYPIGDDGRWYGQKLYYWPIPDGVEVVQDTHIAPENFQGIVNIAGTYGEYLAKVNVKPRKDKDNNPLPSNTQMIADPLPSSVREVYNYFYGVNLVNDDGTNFKYPRLPEGCIAVQDYFTLDCHERGSDGLVIPGLPSTVRFIKGYCKNLLKYSPTVSIDSQTGAPKVSLQDIDNLELEENLCNNVESVEDWMSGTYDGYNINLLHNPEKLIRPVPTLSPTGKTLNSFNNAFKIFSNILVRTTSAEDRPDGEPVVFDYLFWENRWLSIQELLPYLSDLSDSTVHANAYSNAFSGNYHGAIEELEALTSLTAGAIISINDGYEGHSNWNLATPIYTEEELIELRDVGTRGGRRLTYGGVEINSVEGF